MMEIELNQRAAEQRKEKEATKTITKKYKKKGEALALVEKEVNKIVIEVVEKAENKTELRKSRLMAMWREIAKASKNMRKKKQKIPKGWKKWKEKK